jgi:hypothetical protein
MIDLTPLLRFYAARRQTSIDRQDPASEQENQLLELVRRAADTAFGRDHQFEGINSVAGFQERVPLRSYQEFWSEYWQPVFPTLADCTWPGKIPYFVTSSGTSTGQPKHLPYTLDAHKANSRAGLNVMAYHVLNRPHSKVLGGMSLMLGMSASAKEIAPGVFSGDLGGIAALRMPWWSHRRVLPPQSVSQMPHWDDKVDRMARLALDRDIRTIAGTPTWLLEFFDRLFCLRPQHAGKLRHYFPRLELVIHGSMNFAPYRAEFASLLEGSGAETREVYASSEGYIAAADRDPGSGLRLNTDHGLFYEFVPLADLGSQNPPRHWLANVECDTEYALVLSSCAGLWAYLLGDTVRFVNLDPPRVLVTGRLSYAHSPFGKYFNSGDLEEAVGSAARAAKAHLANFALGTLPTDGSAENGRNILLVEFRTVPPEPFDAEGFRRHVDDWLRRHSPAYRDSHILGSTEVVMVDRHCFESWMVERNHIKGQYKVAPIMADANLFASLYGRCVGTPHLRRSEGPSDNGHHTT